MEKITSRAWGKLGNIIELIMQMLKCDYKTAYNIVSQTSVYRAIIEGDPATLYQSSPCCIEDIGRELRSINSSLAPYFNNENINKSIDTIRLVNQRRMKMYKEKERARA